MSARFGQTGDFGIECHRTSDGTNIYVGTIIGDSPRVYAVIAPDDASSLGRTLLELADLARCQRQEVRS